MNRKRKSAIVAELSRMSRAGWANARPEEYQALERELRCLCGAARPGDWTAGVHHGAHRCARVISPKKDR